MTFATTILHRLETVEAAQPRLTWYGPEDERVELSGRVLANWVTKATNLLVEESDVEPGSRVELDLSVHWRSLVWGLATLVAGGELVLPAAADDEDDRPEERPDEDEGWGQEADPWDDEDEVEPEEKEDEAFVAHVSAESDVIVTNRTDGAAQAEVVLVIALPALAMQVSEALPVGALDAAAGLMGQGDELTFVEEPDGADVALRLPGDEQISYDGLAAWSAGQLPAALRETTGARVLCRPDALAQSLAHAIATWHAGGSVVLIAEDVPAGQVRHIADTEHVGHRC